MSEEFLIRIENTINKKVKSGEIRMFFKVRGLMASKIVQAELAFEIRKLFFGYTGKCTLGSRAFTHWFYLDLPRRSFNGAKRIDMILRDQRGVVFKCEVEKTKKFDRLV